MRVTCSLGTFSVAAVPGHPGALAVTASDEAELAALKTSLLPDLVVEDRRATVARDEWLHALEQLTDAL